VEKQTFEAVMNSGENIPTNDKNAVSRIDDIIRMIKSIFVTDNKEQTSNLSSVNVEGLQEIDTYVKYHSIKYGFEDRVARNFYENILILNQSVDGWKTDKLIAAFQPIHTEIKDENNIQGGKLIKLG